MDDGGLQLVVQPLGLLHTVMHRPVDEDHTQDNEQKCDSEPGDVEAGQQNLKCLYCSSYQYLSFKDCCNLTNQDEKVLPHNFYTEWNSGVH